ncbi:MAG: type II toxin-antitoxin system RelE/ParE family toxin [Porticoccaceae bacterium]
MRLTFTRSAQRDLVRLREFIAEKNPESARRISQELREGIGKITDQPHIGVDVENMPGIQDLVRGDYIVRYLVRHEEVAVLRIWHGKEDR